MSRDSAMRRTMARQPDDLRRILADPEPVERVAERLRGRPVVLVGTGTSWHAANQGAWFLRAAGVDGRALEAIDAALYGLPPGTEEAGLVVLSHKNTKRFGLAVVQGARAHAGPVVVVSALGRGGDLETVEVEQSAAFTASHLGALARLAQLAEALGARLGPLGEVPDAVASALDGPGPGVAYPPRRLLELTGVGPNAWTAAEGALKVRETARVAAEGLGVEQLLHGPSVALGPDDALVALDGGGPGAERLGEVAAAAEDAGVRVHRVEATALGELLSVFPLTVAVQRVALDCAEALGTDPDAFGRDDPRRAAAWGAVTL